MRTRGEGGPNMTKNTHFVRMFIENATNIMFSLTHSRRDLLNVMDFEYLQLGGFLGIMSVKEFWNKTN